MLYKRLIKLVLGLFLCALGVITTIKANIGYAPWDVFHVGVSNTISLSIGKVSILTGLTIILLTFFLGEKPGLGTIFNMILVGTFMDFILYLNIIPTANKFFPGLIMMLLGILIMSIGTYFYMSAGFGSGPRDGLMVISSKKLKLPVGFCRVAIEIIVTAIGFLLGGLFGAGTFVYAILIGVFIEWVFRFFNYDPTSEEQESLTETLKSIKLTK